MIETGGISFPHQLKHVQMAFELAALYLAYLRDTYETQPLALNAYSRSGWFNQN